LTSDQVLEAAGLLLGPASALLSGLEGSLVSLEDGSLSMSDALIVVGGDLTRFFAACKSHPVAVKLLEVQEDLGKCRAQLGVDAKWHLSPSAGEALTAARIKNAVDHLRDVCAVLGSSPAVRQRSAPGHGINSSPAATTVPAGRVPAAAITVDESGSGSDGDSDDVFTVLSESRVARAGGPDPERLTVGQVIRLASGHYYAKVRSGGSLVLLQEFAKHSSTASGVSKRGAVVAAESSYAVLAHRLGVGVAVAKDSGVHRVLRSEVDNVFGADGVTEDGKLLLVKGLLPTLSQLNGGVQPDGFQMALSVRKLTNFTAKVFPETDLTRSELTVLERDLQAMYSTEAAFLAQWAHATTQFNKQATAACAAAAVVSPSGNTEMDTRIRSVRLPSFRAQLDLAATAAGLVPLLSGRHSHPPAGKSVTAVVGAASGRLKATPSQKRRVVGSDGGGSAAVDQRGVEAAVTAVDEGGGSGGKFKRWCHYFQRQGGCRRGDSCTFWHGTSASVGAKKPKAEAGVPAPPMA
jgi:hypothetical protein